MRLLIFKISALLLLLSFSAEIITPVYSDNELVFMLSEYSESRDKKEESSKDKEDFKDKIISFISNELFVISRTNNLLCNCCPETVSYKSLPEIPPERI